MAYCIKYTDDCGIKHMCILKSEQEINFLIERYGNLDVKPINLIL